MVTRGPAKKLTVYVDEADKIGKIPVYEAIVDLLYRRKIAGASVFRGIAGYGSDGVYHTAKILDLSVSLPVRIEAVDSEEIINSVLPDIAEMLEQGLIEVSDTFVVKCCSRLPDKH